MVQYFQKNIIWLNYSYTYITLKHGMQTGTNGFKWVRMGADGCIWGGKRNKIKVPKKKKKENWLPMTVNSIWRVTTKDPVQTETDKEVLSGWQRYKILSHTEEQVTVQYLDDNEDDDPLTYDISDITYDTTCTRTVHTWNTTSIVKILF